ncbi:hypothetical protein CR513_22009, partial [Mucuna pruriens]
MRAAAQTLQAQDFQRIDGRGNKSKKGKWKNKLRDSSEGQKNSNQNSSSNNYKKNEGHGKFSKKGGDHRGGQRKFDKRNIQCYACQKWGHFADECYSNKGKQKKENEAQMAQGDSDDLDHVLLMVTTSDCAKSDFWYLDIVCSNHMIGNKGWFVNLDEKVKRMVKFTDNNTITAEGIDKVYLIKRKGKAFEVFKGFKTMMKKQCGYSIKVLRTDGDGEYISHDFHSYYDKEGRIHEVQLCRSQRTRQSSERFGDYTSIPDFEVTEEGDMMHLALLAETEPLSNQ